MTLAHTPAPDLPWSARMLLDGLVQAGLDDDAARLITGFSQAHRDIGAAERAERELGGLVDRLRVLAENLDGLAERVRSGLDVDWRSTAAAEYGERTDGLYSSAVDRAQEADEWRGLLSTAQAEATRAREDAEERARREEEAARSALRALAAAS